MAGAIASRMSFSSLKRKQPKTFTVRIIWTWLWQVHKTCRQEPPGAVIIIVIISIARRPPASTIRGDVKQQLLLSRSV
ncbi:Merlin [Myotis davidii]|uniref:Merlin n=1 Tax=Myotis davidii TaxID=225400 RepID=L5LZS3_MYODS|nr:Merlin [Myotis davidii]